MGGINFFILAIERTNVSPRTSNYFLNVLYINASNNVVKLIIQYFPVKCSSVKL